MKFLAIISFSLFANCALCSMSKQQLLLRSAELQNYLRDWVSKFESEQTITDENEIAVFKLHAQLLKTLNEALRLPIDSDLLLSSYEKTLSGIETTILTQMNKIQFYGSHLLHGSTTPGTGTPAVITDNPTEGTKGTVTEDSRHSTDSIPETNDFNVLIKRAVELQEKAKTAIKKLTDSHRIPEALNLESDVKHLEQKIDELKIYLGEMNSIKSELITIEDKIQKEIKNL